MKIFKYKHIIVYITALAVFSFLGGVYITYFREWFWTAVQLKNLNDFYILITYFSLVAIGLVLVGAVSTYLLNRLGLYYRIILTRRSFKCLENNTISKDIKVSVGQRVQEDCRDYPALGINFLQSVFSALLLGLFYLYMTLTYLPWYLLIIVLVYVVISTTVTCGIGYPLINLNYINQNVESLFRQKLSKRIFGQVHRNNINLFRYTKLLNYFQIFYAQLNVIFPYLLMATLYFSGHISFGVYMQIAAVINGLVDCMGVLISNVDVVNKWLSCRRRLKEIGVV